MPIVGIYVRVSTEEQARHGFSLEHQLTECKRVAEKDFLGQDITFLEYTDDGYSGEYIERPNLTRLRQDLKNGMVDHVFCYDLDRLARNLIHQLILDGEFSKKGLSFVVGDYQNTPEGKMFFQMRGAIAEFEKAKINERMSNGRKTKALKGQVVKDYHTYGYEFDKVLNQMIVNETEAETVRFIFDAFTGGDNGFKGMNGIAKHLTGQGIPTKKGNATWHRQVVRQILMSRAYIGEFFQNRWDSRGSLGRRFGQEFHVSIRPQEEWIRVECPVIIEKAQFEYAQGLLGVSRQRWAGTSKNQYLLSGLVRCMHCGNTMTGRNAKNWGTYTLEYTDIKNTAGAKTHGCGARVKCSVLDEIVWNRVLDEIRKAENPIDDDSTDIEEQAVREKERIEKAIEKKEAARKQFIKSVVSGQMVGMSQNEINDALAASNGEIEKLKERQAETDSDQMQHELQQARRDRIREAMTRYIGRPTEDFGFEEKKHLIRLLIREIRYDSENVEISTF